MFSQLSAVDYKRACVVRCKSVVCRKKDKKYLLVNLCYIQNILYFMNSFYSHNVDCKF